MIKIILCSIILKINIFQNCVLFSLHRRQNKILINLKILTLNFKIVYINFKMCTDNTKYIL